MGTLDLLRNAMDDDPLPWATWVVGCRAAQKLKSRLLASIFHAPGLYLGKGSVVKGSRHVKFGKNLYVTSGLWLEAVTRYGGQRFDPRIEIGDNVCLSHSVHISAIESVVIGDGVLMGSHIYISDHNHGVYRGDTQSHPSESPAHRKLGGGGPVAIGENVWIGDNGVIRPGPATVGNGAILAANSGSSWRRPARVPSLPGFPPKP